MIRHLLLAALFAAASTTAAFASSDELYYPASNCLPFDGTAWHGGGSQGFGFVLADRRPVQLRLRPAEALVCPVPYFRDTNDLKPITVRVVVEDLHHQSGILAFLCGRDSTGSKICDSGDNFPTVFGISTIELTIQPTAAIRFVWIEVAHPRQRRRQQSVLRPGHRAACWGIGC